MGNNFHAKFDFGIKGSFAFQAVGINKVGGIGDVKVFLTEEPLVPLDLFFVALFIFIIQANFFGGAGGFVINNVELVLRVNPQIINDTAKLQVGGFVQGANTFVVMMIVAPFG